jgi:hypothetical protein
MIKALPMLRTLTMAALGLACVPVHAGFLEEPIEGWSVHFDAALAANAPELTDRLRRLLHDNLQTLTGLVPPKRVDELRRVPIYVWMGAGPKHGSGAYYANGNAFRDGTVPPAAVMGGVVIDDPRSAVRWLSELPSGLLHELAHAYHDQVLGMDDPRIVSAYQHALAHHLYEHVLDRTGQTVPRSYALTSKAEYFALLTQAYFWRSGYFPFTRSDLQLYDPVGFGVVRAAWEERPGPQPARRIPLGAARAPCPRGTDRTLVVSAARAMLTLRNRTGQPIGLWWLHRDGTRTQYPGIGAFGYRTQPSYANQSWEIEDALHNCLARIDLDALGDSVELVP